jgi:hypothetical protein
VTRPQSAPAGQLRLSGPVDVAALMDMLDRLARYEPLGVVRLRSRGAALGVFAQPPFGALVMRAVRLADAAVVDVTVPYGELARALRAGGLGAELPASVPGPAWAGLLPPTGGWRQVASAPRAAVRDAVAAGVRDFRAAVDELPPELRTSRHALDGIAAATWDRPVVAGVPLRCAHAAAALGFLADDVVSVHTAGPWLRLDGGAGSAFARTGGVGDLRLA